MDFVYVIVVHSRDSYEEYYEVNAICNTLTNALSTFDNIVKRYKDVYRNGYRVFINKIKCNKQSNIDIYDDGNTVMLRNFNH